MAQKAGLPEGVGGSLDVGDEPLEIPGSQLAGQAPFELDRQGAAEKPSRRSAGGGRRPRIQFGRGLAQVAGIDARLLGDLLQLTQAETAAPGGRCRCFTLKFGRAFEDQADFLLAVAPTEFPGVRHNVAESTGELPDLQESRGIPAGGLRVGACRGGLVRIVASDGAHQIDHDPPVTAAVSTPGSKVVPVLERPGSGRVAGFVFAKGEAERTRARDVPS